MKCCVLADVGTWTNCLSFEPNTDRSLDAGNGLLSGIVYALLRGILRRGKSRRAPTVSRGFKMVLFTEVLEHICRR